MTMTQDGYERPYPVVVRMEHPERLSRLSTFFRIFLAIPIFIFLALLGAGSFNFNSWGADGAQQGGLFAGGAAGGIVVAIWATILVRGNIPRWLFDFQVGLNRFTLRAYSYFALLTDQYPAFEGAWDLDYDVEYPDRLSRWKLLFYKFFSAIPHFIALLFLGIGAFVVVVIGWFAILFTGNFPRGLHQFVVGVARWGARVEAYVQSLTDAFPPFSLEEDAPPGSRAAEVISAVIGGIIVALAVAGAIVAGVLLFLYFHDSKSSDVNLQEALDGNVPAQQASLELDGAVFTLIALSDPAPTSEIVARPGKRMVEALLQFDPDGDVLEDDFGFGEFDDEVEPDMLRLVTSDGTEHPVLLTMDGVPAPIERVGQTGGELRALFEVDEDVDIEELRAYTGKVNRHVAWEFD